MAVTPKCTSPAPASTPCPRATSSARHAPTGERLPRTPKPAPTPTPQRVPRAKPGRACPPLDLRLPRHWPPRHRLLGLLPKPGHQDPRPPAARPPFPRRRLPSRRLQPRPCRQRPHYRDRRYWRPPRRLRRTQRRGPCGARPPWPGSDSAPCRARASTGCSPPTSRRRTAPSCPLRAPRCRWPRAWPSSSRNRLTRQDTAPPFRGRRGETRTGSTGSAASRRPNAPASPRTGPPLPPPSPSAGGGARSTAQRGQHGPLGWRRDKKHPRSAFSRRHRHFLFPRKGKCHLAAFLPPPLEPFSNRASRCALKTLNFNRLHTHTHPPKRLRLAHPRSPIPPLSTLTSRATHAHPTSPRSTGFCARWDCISSSSSSSSLTEKLMLRLTSTFPVFIIHIKAAPRPMPCVSRRRCGRLC